MGNTAVDNNAAVLDLLIEKVYQDGGRDFREYKRSTVMRRLERRLHATGSKTCSDYMQFLDIHPEEYHQLAEDLTIKVSGFFRSPYTFAQVANLVIPEVVSHKRSQGGHSLRFWSAACAQGEEPYSLSILLAEVFRERFYWILIFQSTLPILAGGPWARHGRAYTRQRKWRNYRLPSLKVISLPAVKAIR